MRATFNVVASSAHGVRFRANTAGVAVAVATFVLRSHGFDVDEQVLRDKVDALAQGAACRFGSPSGFYVRVFRRFDKDDGSTADASDLGMRESQADFGLTTAERK